MHTIIVKGIPKSIQSSPVSLNSWKTQVGNSARNALSSPSRSNHLNVRITVYYNGVPTFDTDNISKPNIDALKGIAYHDDAQIMERIARKRSLNGAYRIKGVDTALATAIAEGSDFVCIEIKELSRKEVERLI